MIYQNYVLNQSKAVTQLVFPVPELRAYRRKKKVYVLHEAATTRPELVRTCMCDGATRPFFCLAEKIILQTNKTRGPKTRGPR